MVADSPIRIPFGEGIASSSAPSSSPSSSPTSTPTAATTATCQKLSVSKITANGDDGNVPANAIDNSLSTRWSNLGKGSWIQVDLGSQMTICSVDVAWYRGNERQVNFVISVSNDSSAFNNILTGKSSGKTLSAENYDFADVTSRYVRITINGNTQNDWASITELAVNGFSSNNPPPPPPPPPTGGTTGTQLYTPLSGGRVFTKMNPTGDNCKSDGIRFNIANEHTLVDRESTWIFTVDNDPSSCTDKPYWNPKIGSHGSTGEASGLYEASVYYKGGFKSMRSEGPHPEYHSCSGYTHASDIPPMPKGKQIGVKTAQWRIPNGVHVEFWYDFTGGGKGPWIKYASLDDTLPGHCNGGSIKGPIGMNGMLIGPAKAQDTMRMNGASATYISGSIVELAPSQTPKGTISSISSTPSASPAATDDNLIASHQAIAKESLFNKGQKDGKKDAKIFASAASTATSDQKTNAPTSMTPDDVDCEAPDNLSGQDSIDYCKGYGQGFAKQNNLMAEK